MEAIGLDEAAKMLSEEINPLEFFHTPSCIIGIMRKKIREKSKLSICPIDKDAGVASSLIKVVLEVMSVLITSIGARISPIKNDSPKIKPRIKYEKLLLVNWYAK